MSTGNKTVRSRQNASSRAANKPERRGGARSKSGPAKKAPIAREDLRKEFIERLEIVNADKKQLGKHWLDMWIQVLQDPRYRLTNAGGKLISDMFHFIFNEPIGSRTPWKLPLPQPPGKGEQDGGTKSGASGLPPLKPDPANVASFNKGEQR